MGHVHCSNMGRKRGLARQPRGLSVKPWAVSRRGGSPVASIVPGQLSSSPHEYPNLPAYLIFDAQYLKKYYFANQPIGSEVPKSVLRGGSLPELAAKLAIDREQLEKTVRRFNGFVRNGADEDFQRGESQWKLASMHASAGANGSLGTIEQPPFYGIELHPAGGPAAFPTRPNRTTTTRRK